MTPSIQEEIDMYKYHIKLSHCIATSVILITSCVAALPVIFAIIKIDSYGRYIIVGAVALYIICLLVIIAKWFLTVSEYKMKIRRKTETMTMRSPIYRV